jgi:hypothetical protein
MHAGFNHQCQPGRGMVNRSAGHEGACVRETESEVEGSRLG